MYSQGPESGLSQGFALGGNQPPKRKVSSHVFHSMQRSEGSSGEDDEGAISSVTANVKLPYPVLPPVPTANAAGHYNMSQQQQQQPSYGGGDWKMSAKSPGLMQGQMTPGYGMQPSYNPMQQQPSYNPMQQQPFSPMQQSFNGMQPFGGNPMQPSFNANPLPYAMPPMMQQQWWPDPMSNGFNHGGGMIQEPMEHGKNGKRKESLTPMSNQLGAFGGGGAPQYLIYYGPMPMQSPFPFQGSSAMSGMQSPMMMPSSFPTDKPQYGYGSPMQQANSAPKGYRSTPSIRPIQKPTAIHNQLHSASSSLQSSQSKRTDCNTLIYV